MPGHFLNRELSWLEFNQRVLDEALDTRNPLLERLKFFCIVSSNLDEFFEVRVAGLKQQIESEVVERSMDGLTASETFRAISKRVRRMVADQYACWREELLPGAGPERASGCWKAAELDAAGPGVDSRSTTARRSARCSRRWRSTRRIRFRNCSTNRST